MTTQWIPISPDLNEKGNFIALSHMENADALKPLTSDSIDLDYNQFKITQSFINVNMAIKLGLFNALNIDASSKVFTFYYEAAIFSDLITTIPVGDLIFGTRYGTGYRILLKISNFDVNVGLSITNIAAQATLGKAQVEFELYGFGFPNNASILADAPNPSDFNVDAWVKISEYTTSLKKYIKENLSTLSPKPYNILADVGKIIDNTYEFQSYLFAYKKIDTKTNLSDALKIAGNKYNSGIIKEVYKALNVNDNLQPSSDQANAAHKIMNVL
jgi:hypothetical protein